MDYDELLSIKILPKKMDKSTFEVREEGLYHTAYKDEIRLFSCIKEGNLKRLFTEMKNRGGSSILVGNMANSDIMQYKYMAVSSITLATRYAIQGGLDEAQAYDFSDKFIRDIDKTDNTVQIMRRLVQSIMKLTLMVQSARKEPKHSPYIKKCIVYIDKNLNKKLSVGEIAEECGISADYLSQIFKKETGENLSAYILRQKLEAAQALIFDGYDSASICYSLGFGSQSYFISSFKKQFGITPNEYATAVK